MIFGGAAPFLGTSFIKIAGGTIGAVLIGGWMSFMAIIALIAFFYGTYRRKKILKQRVENALTHSTRDQELRALRRQESDIEHDYADQMN